MLLSSSLPSLCLIGLLKNSFTEMIGNFSLWKHRKIHVFGLSCLTEGSPLHLQLGKHPRREWSICLRSYTHLEEEFSLQIFQIYGDSYNSGHKRHCVFPCKCCCLAGKIDVYQTITLCGISLTSFVTTVMLLNLSKLKPIICEMVLLRCED